MKAWRPSVFLLLSGALHVLAVAAWVIWPAKWWWPLLVLICNHLLIAGIGIGNGVADGGYLNSGHRQVGWQGILANNSARSARDGFMDKGVAVGACSINCKKHAALDDAAAIACKLGRGHR